MAKKYNYYNKEFHNILSQYYFFNKYSSKLNYRKYPRLKNNNRHTRLLLNKKINLKRFVYGNLKPKRDKRRL